MISGRFHVVILGGIMNRLVSAICFFICIIPCVCFGHYGMIIPSDSMVMQNDDRNLHLTLSFSHPFEGIGMSLEKPEVFQVAYSGRTRSLVLHLKEAKVMGENAWQTEFSVKRPGVYTFYMKPSPYFEPAEDCYIIHHTKTVVTAFGDDEGWADELGVKTEIVPLAKPFALYAGNLFQGIVRLDGKPVPYAEVEVEYYNKDHLYKAPTEYMITQTIKADENGVFSYAAPFAGWWGFAALNTADFKLPYNGEEKDVELGAVIWVEFMDIQKK